MAGLETFLKRNQDTLVAQPSTCFLCASCDIDLVVGAPSQITRGRQFSRKGGADS